MHNSCSCECCVEHSEAEMTRYRDSLSKLHADIEMLEKRICGYVEQLHLERTKSEQLEIMVSHGADHSSKFQFLRMFVVDCVRSS